MKFEDVEIKISLSSEWWRDPPRCEMYIDSTAIDRLYVSPKRTNFEKRDIVFRGNLTRGTHTLTIRFLNKKDDDDQFDENGIGTLFQHLHIEEITINRINVNIEKSRNRCLLKTEQTKIPYPCRILTTNCDWLLIFSVPTYLWLMEHS